MKRQVYQRPIDGLIAEHSVANLDFEWKDKRNRTYSAELYQLMKEAQLTEMTGRLPGWFTPTFRISRCIYAPIVDIFLTSFWLKHVTYATDVERYMILDHLMSLNS